MWWPELDPKWPNSTTIPKDVKKVSYPLLSRCYPNPLLERTSKWKRSSQQPQRRLGSEVTRKGKIVKDFLSNEILTIDNRIKVRGIGLIWGVDFSGFDEDITKPLIAACFKNGLIIERVGRENNVLKIMPPLVIEDTILIKGLEIIRDSLKEIL